eukprot:TRINITY_DN66388_c0_g1_i1.p1 TRINITY_DN66388_c0_g1~~TRINITY_DN66388_c0_g1_i1.p1  ORF type:complete len:281 (+),score=94.65 TRINITY_DN66388_c0_g1_i1:73-915(+)
MATPPHEVSVLPPLSVASLSPAQLKSAGATGEHYADDTGQRSPLLSEGESDDEDNLADPDRYIRPFACPRTGEPLRMFCHTTRELTSLVCPIYTHKGTQIELLRDFCARERQRLVPKKEQVETLLRELYRLREQVQQRANQLHKQVDIAVADVIHRLNRRRAALHADIKARGKALMDTLEGELITRKQELQTLGSAKLTLSLLSSGRGVAPDGDIGGVLRGEHTYDQFLAIGDPALQPAPVIKETLKLNLPLQLRDEVLHFDWTAETRNLQPLVYPPKGF